MNQNKIKIEKLIVQFASGYHKIKENKELLMGYKNYCKNLIKEYENKFNEHNKNVQYLMNLEYVFIVGNKYSDKPCDLLYCGLDYSDDVLVDFFQDLKLD